MLLYKRDNKWLTCSHLLFHSLNSIETPFACEYIMFLFCCLAFNSVSSAWQTCLFYSKFTGPIRVIYFAQIFGIFKVQAKSICSFVLSLHMSLTCVCSYLLERVANGIFLPLLHLYSERFFNSN